METKQEKVERIVRWDCIHQHLAGVSIKDRVLISMETEPIASHIKVLVFKKFVLTYASGRKTKSGHSYWMELVKDEQADMAKAYSKKRKVFRKSDVAIIP